MTKASLKGKIPTNDLTQVKPNAIESSVTKKKKKHKKTHLNWPVQILIHTHTQKQQTWKQISYCHTDRKSEDM